MLLGIDIGTTHIKVGQYAKDGTVLAHVKALTPKVSVADTSHYLPDDLWYTSCALIKETVRISRTPIKALALAGMGEAGLFIDDEGNAVYPIIPWNDLRASKQCERLTQDNAEQWFAITGVYPNPIHSIFKWLWLKENEKECWHKASTWLSTMGFIRYKLTGKASMELSQAARTMAYDVNQNCWSADLLEQSGIEASLLPELLTGTSEAGCITEEAATITGLTEGTTVYAGGHDHICASLACGVLEGDIALDSVGTAEGLTFGLPMPAKPSASQGFATGPHVIEGHSYLLGGIFSSGGALAWLKDLFKLERFDDLIELAKQVKPADAPLFIPHFYGEAPPFNHSSAKAAFLQVEPHHQKEHFVRAVYEGLAFEIRRHIEAFEALTAKPVTKVKVVGTPSEARLWLEIRSSILGKTLELSEHSDMVTLGAALLAGIGAGIYTSPEEALEQTTKQGFVIEPNAKVQASYETRYKTYKRLVKVLTQAL